MGDLTFKLSRAFFFFNDFSCRPEWLPALASSRDPKLPFVSSGKRAGNRNSLDDLLGEVFRAIQFRHRY